MITQFHITKGIVMAKKNTTAQSQPQIDYDAIFQEQYDKQIATEERKYNRYMKQPHDTSEKQHHVEYIEQYKEVLDKSYRMDRLLTLLYSGYLHLINGKAYKVNTVKNFFRRNKPHYAEYYKNQVIEETREQKTVCKSLSYSEEKLLRVFAMYCAMEDFSWRLQSNNIEQFVALRAINEVPEKEPSPIEDSKAISEMNEYIYVLKQTAFVRIMTTIRDANIIGQFSVRKLVRILRKPDNKDNTLVKEFSEVDYNGTFRDIFGDKDSRNAKDTLKPQSQSNDPELLQFIILMTKHLKPDALRELKKALNEKA